jgi:hypothetical protein
MVSRQENPANLHYPCLDRHDGEYRRTGSMLIGTATGLIIKYILDKCFIFFFHTCDLGHNARMFGLYATMG